MISNRLKVLLGVAAVLFVAVVWYWASGWGRVTIHAEAEPLAKVVRSIERQGGITIATNADAALPVTLHLDRVTAAEAVDALAGYVDGNWSVTYVAGPSKAEVASGIALLRSGERSDAFARFGGGGGGGPDFSDAVIDARRVEWKVSPSDKPELQAYVDQLTQKTGLAALVAKDWNPAVAKAPEGGAAGKAMETLVDKARGKTEAVFVVRVRSEDPRMAGGPGGGGPPPWAGGGPGGFSGRSNVREDWMQERALARIEQLPAAEREQARKDYNEMRTFFEQMRSLPEAERRAAMEKFFSSPAVQERMTDRMLSREARRSPEQRAERYRRYIERKFSAQSQPPTAPAR